MPAFSLAPVGSTIPAGTPGASGGATPPPVTPLPSGDPLLDEGILPTIEGNDPFVDAPTAAVPVAAAASPNPAPIPTTPTELVQGAIPVVAPAVHTPAVAIPPAAPNPPLAASSAPLPVSPPVLPPVAAGTTPPLAQQPRAQATVPAGAPLETQVPGTIHREHVAAPSTSPSVAVENAPHAELTGPAKIVRDSAPVAALSASPSAPEQRATTLPAETKIVRAAPPPQNEPAVIDDHQPAPAVVPDLSTSGGEGMSIQEKLAIQNSIGGAHENVESLRKEVRGTQATVTTLTNSVQQILTESQTSKAELERLTAALAAAPTHEAVLSMSEQLRASEAQIAELRSHIAQLESLLATVRELHDRVSNLPATITDVVANSMVMHVTFEAPQTVPAPEPPPAPLPPQ